MKKSDRQAKPCKYCQMPAVIHENEHKDESNAMFIECHHRHGCVLELVHRATFNHIDEAALAMWNGDQTGLTEEEAAQKKNCNTCAAFRSNVPCMMQQYHTDDCWLPKSGDIVEALIDMVQQHCLMNIEGDSITYLDSMGLSANADAMRLLARMGKMEVKQEYGKRVIGCWVTEEGGE